MIVCAGEIESFSYAKSIGIGLIDPCINLSNLIQKQSPEQIIFVGTMGLYDENLPLLGVYESKSATQIEISKLLNLSYSPLQNAVSNTAQVSENHTQNQKQPNEIYPQIIINSSNYITQDSHISGEFLKLGLFGENMEFYSVLSTAKHYGIRAYGVFCATNHTNKNAHQDFITNHAKAKQILTNYLKNKGLI